MATVNLIEACKVHGESFDLFGPAETLHEGHCSRHGCPEGPCADLKPYLAVSSAHELWRVTVVECTNGNMGGSCLKYFFEGQHHGWPIIESLETQAAIRPEDTFASRMDVKPSKNPYSDFI